MIRTHRSIRARGLRLAAAAGVSLLGASAAQAQWGGYPVGNGGSYGQLVFEWQGNVDRETQINVGRSNVSVRGVNGNESRGRFVARGSLPRGNGTLYVPRLDGRGNVDIIQQPGNGYGDGIVRIRDGQGGQDFYSIRVYWRGTGTTTAGRNDGTYGRNDGTYGRNDGTWDRTGSGAVSRDRDGDGDYDRADRRIEERRADQAERRADKAERKAEKAREKARRKADRDGDRRRW
jgi:hypothetical protein